jgi:hypothetical protein
VFTGVSVCVCVADILMFSTGEFLISAGIGSLRNCCDGAALIEEAEDTGDAGAVSGGSSSTAACGTASAKRVSGWYAGAASADGMIGSSDTGGGGAK